ncbi:MAG: hypothetical protein ABSE73_18060 [Planctomycetota bacterium]
MSKPNQVARKFRAAKPPREKTLEAACRQANKDKVLEKEIKEWQGFEDPVTL